MPSDVVKAEVIDVDRLARALAAYRRASRFASSCSVAHFDGQGNPIPCPYDAKREAEGIAREYERDA